jgi:hypothetical protein
MSAFLSVDLLTDFAAFCSTDFIDWRYTHSWFVFSTQLVNCCPHGQRNYTCVLLPLYCTFSGCGGVEITEYTYLYKRWNRVSVSNHSAGAYTATLLVMVNVIKGVGVHPPPSPAQTNFTLMTECTPESRRYYSLYSVVEMYRGPYSAGVWHPVSDQIQNLQHCFTTPNKNDQ